MTQPAPTFYVFHGSDEFTQAETVADFRKQIGPPEVIDLNTTRFKGRSVTFGELRHACEAIPFLSEKRLVIVTDLLQRLQSQKGKFLDDLLELLPHIPETTRLVFLETKALSSRHAVLKLAREDNRGYVRRFEPPSDTALPRWIVQRAKKHGGVMTPAAANRLAQLVGNDLRLLDQEIIKLVTYAGSEGEITPEEIVLLVPYAQEAIIFDLVDALGQRNGRVATTTLQNLIEAGEHPMGVLAMVVRQFRLIIQVKELREAGENAASVAQTLKLHPFPAGKLYAQAANFTPGQLEQIYRHLLALDVKIKRGKITPEIAMELLAAGLAEPGRS